MVEFVNNQHTMNNSGSEIMVEELDLAKLTLTIYYRTHEQETEAEHVEKEFEEIKKHILEEV